MAVSSLRYRPNAPPPQESNHGYVMFDGKATEYHHWLFRTQLKLRTAKKTDIANVIQTVVENLRCEALHVAMQIGIDALIASDGSGGELLIDRMKEHIFPVAQQEAKALYKECHNVKDVALTRQSGESMQNYIFRRRGGRYSSSWIPR